MNYLFNLEIARCNSQSMLKLTVNTCHYLTKQAAPPVSPGSYMYTWKIFVTVFPSFGPSKPIQLRADEKDYTFVQLTVVQLSDNFPITRAWGHH